MEKNLDSKKIENSKKSTNENNKKTNKKFVIFILALLIIVGGFTAISNDNQSKINYNNNVYQQIPVNQYNVKIHIDFTENVLFSKYNVILSVGAEKITLTHGENKDIEVTLEEGTHTLYFKNAEDSSIQTETTLDVDCNMEVGYSISCHYDKISVTNLYIDKDEAVGENEAEIKNDKTEFVSKNYKEVIEKLKEIGFTNIVEKPIYDIVSSVYSEGEVENVTINGIDTYKRGDIFDKNVEVVVSYHLLQSSDPSKIKAPYDSESAKEVNYADVVKAFEDAGFKNIITEEKTETDMWGNKDGAVSSIIIAGSAADKNKGYNSYDEVTIYYYDITSSGRSETQLSSGYAQLAFEKYGESIYKYGFKCHWLIGLINEEQRPDGSWFIKVEVTIKNAFGTEYDTIAEGIVSGSDANPKVTQFYVSQ